MFGDYAAELSPYSMFGDKRINTKFPEIIHQLGENFEQTLPQSAKDNAQMQSIYNFFFQPIGQVRVYAFI